MATKSDTRKPRYDPANDPKQPKITTFMPKDDVRKVAQKFDRMDINRNKRPDLDELASQMSSIKLNSTRHVNGNDADYFTDKKRSSEYSKIKRLSSKTEKVDIKQDKKFFGQTGKFAILGKVKPEH